MTIEERIQVAKEKFDRRLRNKSTKIKHDFDWWFERFKNDCLPLSEIGKEAGFKPSAARQAAYLVFGEFFSDILPNRPNGRARQKFCAIKTRRFKLKDFSKVPSHIKKIVELLQSAGHKAELVPTAINPNGFHRFCATSSKMINVDGKWRVSVHSCTKSKIGYGKFTLTYDEVIKSDFVILYNNIVNYTEQIFILPVEVILGHWPKDVHFKWFYTPLMKKTVFRGPNPKIDFWQYLDAWHLIPKPPVSQ